jgi:hypothetical protein
MLLFRHSGRSGDGRHRPQEKNTAQKEYALTAKPSLTTAKASRAKVTRLNGMSVSVETALFLRIKS